MSMTASDVLKMVKDNEAKFVDFRFTDTKGKEQHVSVPVSQFGQEKFDDGHAFDGSSIAGWKGIAAYFGRDERTVMRWAAERGLPVRRMPGQKRASVYALANELAAWRDAGTVAAEPAPTVVPAATPAAPPVATPDSTVATRAYRWLPTAAMVGAGLVIAATVFSTARPHHADRPRPPVPVASTNPAAEAAYLQASYDFAQRTAASLRRAVAGFRAAIAADPRSAASYAGLGETYLLLREYSTMPGSEAYAEARAAADAAVAIDPDLPAAHRVLAFVDFWSAGDIPAARAEFARALALAPQDAQTHHWFATALSANGEAAAALREIETARRLDPNSTAILAGAGLLTYLAGHRVEAQAMLRAVIANHPDESSSHQYLSDIAVDDGDDATFLAEASRAAELRGDKAGLTLMAAARRGAAGGHAAMLRAMYATLAAARGPNGSWFSLAQVAGLQDNAKLALELLRRAAAAHDPAMMTINTRACFASLRTDPNFIALARRPSLQL